MASSKVQIVLRSRRQAKATVERICCLTGNDGWTAPDGEFCPSKRHGHLSAAKVNQLVAEGRMEWVQGYERRMILGESREVKVWIPVARFVVGPEWRKAISDPHGAAPMAVMQLI